MKFTGRSLTSNLIAAIGPFVSTPVLLFVYSKITGTHGPWEPSSTFWSYVFYELALCFISVGWFLCSSRAWAMFATCVSTELGHYFYCFISGHSLTLSSATNHFFFSSDWELLQKIALPGLVLAFAVAAVFDRGQGERYNKAMDRTRSLETDMVMRAMT